ncbi:protein of unknown function DUF214 [Catenulispora acidiphila DSM 44928]|uniref:ABC3 transporter permease protein domain-containing protein n=1 Tax=Catenulispora acidiphila (strain DSM 44928 / JCM 14897 / NBRC 102108 / NRRL B-24433 / ID139908) TaxID=479433 RepID=C7Q494_CATAD|nr:ABC transporter permease [Catenulispora acidiphila]ACU69954.1 protein of unknown function DUF214 [Catenulispora acidiphila DSM 44928]
MKRGEAPGESAATADRKRPKPSRLGVGDIARVGAGGLRTRPVRAFLSALGIGIGISAMIAVVGISTSGQADLNRRLAAIGTNLLRVAPGQTLFGGTTHLPTESIGMIARIGPVTSVSAIGTVTANVYRSSLIPSGQTGAITVEAARTDLLPTVGATVASGTWLSAATSKYPAVVLGAAAARLLGVGAASPGTQVWLGGSSYTVVGILNPVPLAPELDTAAMVGWPQAASALGFDGHPTTVYTRTRDDSVASVQAILGATANPEHPDEVKVSRPSDALAAKQAANSAVSGLLLGLGAVALLVGGIGVANTMVISVLERRAEIGLRRSLGATRGQIRSQFLAESLLLSALGGVGGVAVGIAVTAGYASFKGWPSVVPAWVSTGGVAATVVIGGFAGLYPAWRAARMSPTEALSVP